MTEEKSAPRRGRQASKEPFIGSEDRPEVKIDLDTPLSELRVRELSAILGFSTGKNPNFEVGKTSLKDFFDKPWPEVAKDWAKEIKIEKVEKPEKPEKLEKLEKFEKPEKEKLEKLEKNERKDIKHEKLEKLEKIETDGFIDRQDFIPPGPDPRLEQVIQLVAGLTEQVGRLANQVEALEKKIR